MSVRHTGTVEILGAGVAGLTAARLLAVSGFQVRVRGGFPAPGLTVLLNPGTCRLLEELWDLRLVDLPAMHAVRSRRVHPPVPEPSASVVQHSLAIDSERLARFLAERLRASDSGIRWDGESGDAEWRLLATGRSIRKIGGTVMRFGDAYCAVQSVRTRAGLPADEAIFEALPDGWLFLFPVGSGRAVLQAQLECFEDARGILEENLSNSTHVFPLMEAPIGKPKAFQAMPRLSQPLATDGCLLIGDAAMALPPVTGDGIGNALRTAILATAVLRASRRGESRAALLAHYEWRLRKAFERVAARTGHAVAQAENRVSDFRLEGLDLVRIAEPQRGADTWRTSMSS